MLICPGGGYGFVSDREAEVMALQFTAMGCHAAVLTYSTYPFKYPVQILEAAQAWKLIRDNAERWNVLSDKIIILGCSAGGHLAASYSLFCGEDFVTESVGMTADELRPAGMILCYPVITSGEFAHRDSFATLLGDDYNNLLGTELLEKVSLEKQVTEKTPPAFIWHTYTDNVVPVENSLLFASALRKHNVNCELHIFPDGGHGLGQDGGQSGTLDSHVKTKDQDGVQNDVAHRADDHGHHGEKGEALGGNEVIETDGEKHGYGLCLSHRHIGTVAPRIFKGIECGDRVGDNLGMVWVNLILVELEILQQIEIVVIEVSKTSVKF